MFHAHPDEEARQIALVCMRAKFANVYTHHVPLVHELGAFPVDDKCLLRYLRARNFDVVKASAMLESTIAWRKSFGVDRMLTDWRSTMEVENSTGKTYVRGMDREGHALVYLKPAKENTGEYVGNMRHLVFNLEIAVKNMLDSGRGEEKLILLVDFEGWTLSHSPPLKHSKETMHILQSYYPERLFRAVGINPPFIFSVFWGAISPFIDPVTKAKIMLLKFSKEVNHQKLLDFIDGSILESQYGGLATAPFESSAYLYPYFGEALYSSHPTNTSADE